ncbi:MAG: helix-turn-helix transcriptional regulator [Lachnospiraceae bacterium]|nr:helix-turn-helix transcriptional regulator [Lachnospiraceae bacterium]
MGNTNNPLEDLQLLTRDNVIAQYLQIRKEKDITQAALAKTAKISRPNVARFESGEYNPTLGYLVKLAYAMDMELDIRLVERTAAENKQ